jgi:hypothetical protein
MKVYVVTTTWSGWEDPEANGCTVQVFDSQQKAIEYLSDAVKREIEEEKEFGRDFREVVRTQDYASIASQHAEYVEFEVKEKEVL